jgi:imidazolonepropionase-like amidohydrolase
VQYLPVSASLAVKGGMPYYEALRAITLMPAEITGISDRVGSITVGKDADIQIYSRNFNPLDIMAEPYKVFVSGKEVI